ncbi:4-(cytidine 5'-diphospho)-2-C-methyl-D-erythritol kinase [Fulvimarina sp. 2208YS6-2-32]|uniref:4-diphosphocytidyl-2-C-methyl-D-erythritol kinase n=1 Tax=Fulvimarina uroteuthidis TaxID=3098149 RepID=A0ABU5HZA6_9HYPH|nr:4-(cytidine 5'-diphospho)-2-C-methyl-D-erythritol kinase [Fulvimarina sp. 2208YS6-2-32]MDY8107919.1 4-(cytidine 5'-diphospho)-2-C-methyl-D-erythritol kinase [Fulvimarina sp. 2208YS6-2-32]
MPQSPFEGRIAAPAKVNLALHVVGRRDDGYHSLESLVVFAAGVADALSIGIAEADDLLVEGRFAQGVPTDGRNIVRKALLLARAEAACIGMTIPPLAIRLTKNLPHAAGIGGGSADAAALLRFLCADRPDLRKRLASGASRLGADVPMCLAGTPTLAHGVGDVLTPVAMSHMPAMVLVNPGRPVETPAIFKALRNRDNAPLPPLPAAGLSDPDVLFDWLDRARNDLQETAISIEPTIREACRTLNAHGARLARMSGSGATVFGLFDSGTAAGQCADTVRAARPDWWVAVS